MEDTTGLGCSKRDNAGTDTRTIGDIDGPKKAKSKVDIIMLNMTNKTLILVSY